MADQTERIIIEIDGSSVKGDAQQVERAINTIGDAADKAGKKVTTAEKGMDDLAKSLKTVGAGANLSEKQMQSLQTRIGNTSAARAQSEALKQIASAANLSTRATEALGKRMGVAASEIDRITGASKRASAAVHEIGVNSQRSAASMAMMTNAASAFGVALSVAGLVQFGASVIKAGIAMDALQRSFIAITGSQTAAAQELKFLRKEADRLGQSFFDLAPMYKSVSAAARGTALEGDAVRKVFSSITEASSALGMSTSDTEGALLALGQMISKGTVQAEELRGQLGERLPGAFNIMARALGVTTQELNKMLEQGQVLADEALPKLAAEISKMYGKAAETAALESAQAAVNRLSEAWTSLKTNLFDSRAFVYATNFLRETVEEWDRILFSVSKTELVAQERSTAMLLKAKKEQLANLKGYKGDFITDLFRAGDISKLESEIAELTKKLGAVRGEIASLAPASKDSFAVLQDGMNRAGERAGEYIKDLQAADQELKKLTATALDKLDAQYAALKGRVSDSAALDKWYLAERAKIEEAATKKQGVELKKQVSASKNARAEMIKAAEGVQDMWLVKEKERMDVLSRSYDVMQQKEDELAKAREDAAAEALKIQEAQEKDAQKVMDRIQEGTADVFYDMFQNIEDGWSTLWDSMKNWALRTLAELAARAAMTKIVVPIMTSVTGTANATQAVQAITGGQGGGFNLSSLSSLVQPGSMLSKIPGMSAVTGLLGTSLPGTGVQVASQYATAIANPSLYTTSLGMPASNAVASGALQGTGWGASAVTPATTTAGAMSLGTALSYGGWGGLGYTLLGSQIGLPQNEWSGLTASAGGMLGAWGGSALASSAALAGTSMATGATLGSVIPVVGTAIGAIIGGLAGSLLGGGKEHSPSVIFQAQDSAWGQTDGYLFHTKSKGSYKAGAQISEGLGQITGVMYEQVEGMLGAYGDKYVDMLKDATVHWGRKAGGSWKEWDFGSDKDFEELMGKAAADLQKQIYKAAAPAFSKIGEDFADSDAVEEAYALLENKTKQYGKLDAVIRAGVQDGNVEAYMEQLKAFQAAIANTSATWAAVSEASAQVVEPLSQYEAAQRQLNAQYDGWIANLNALGIAQENIQKIEGDRAAALAKMADDNAKAIQDVINAANEAVTPLSTLAAAQRQINAQFDGLAGQLRNLGAAAEYATQVEASRQAALAAAAAQQASALRYAQAELSGTVDQHKINEIAARYGWGEQYIKDGQINRENVQRDAIDWFKTASKQSVDAMEAHHGVEWQKISEDVKYLDSYFKKLDSASVQVATSHVRASTAVDKTTKAVDKTTDRLGDLAEALAEYRQSLIVGQDSALPLSARLAAAQAEYDRVSRLALAGDQDAAGNLSDVANQWLELSKESAKTQEDYGRTFGDVLRRVDLIVGKLSGKNVPGFAAGGFFSGGLRIVGENGPEMEATGPSRIWSASETRALLSGGDSGASAEIRSLREEVRAIGSALARNTMDTAKMLKRWDGNGMPEVRA